jgi:heat shock protein HslJ
MKLGLFLFPAIVLTACGQAQSNLADSSWTLQSYGTQDNQQKVLENTRITLTFDATAKTVAGSSGCNSYGGKVIIQGDTLNTAEVQMTEIACLDAGVTEQEARYLALLQRVTTFEQTDTLLLLFAGEERLEFTRN